MNLFDSSGDVEANMLTTFQLSDHGRSPVADESHNDQHKSALPVDGAARLASRLARLTVRLEEAVFERDLAQLTQQRLAEELRGLRQTLAQRQADQDLTRWRQGETTRLRAETNSLQQLLAVTRRETVEQQNRAQLLERQLAEQQNRAQLLEQQLAEQYRYLEMIHASRGWLILQSLRRLIGKAW